MSGLYIAAYLFENLDALASANDIVEDAGGARPYRLRLMAQDGGGGVDATAGVALAAGPLSRRGEALDTLIAAGTPAHHLLRSMLITPRE